MNNLRKDCRLALVFVLLLMTLNAVGQQGAPALTTASGVGVVPRLVSYSGVLKDATGKTLTSITGVTFLLYKDQEGGAPVWLETQNVTPDKAGHFTVQLGAASKDGAPPDLFVTGEARWLGLQIGSEPEQPRTMLVAVPYAMKAMDAETIGGLPPSAFMLANPTASSATTSSTGTTAAASTAPPPTSSNVTTTGGAANSIPLFTTATNIQSSILTQTGTTAINVGGKLNLPAMGTASATTKFNSRPETMTASAYNSGTAAAVAQTFQLQAEPVGSNTSTPSGTLNLLYGSGTATPTETGLKISNNGQITFATGQTFPGAGTITKVTAGTAMTGGGSSGAVILNVDTTKIPQLAANNTFSGNQKISGSVTAASFSGNGASVTNVNAAQLGGLASSAFAQLATTNAFTNTNSMSMNSSNPALTLSNAGTGGGLTVNSGGNAEGIFVNGGYVGIEAYGSPLPVWGVTAASNGTAVVGEATDTTATGTGVVGTSTAPNGSGVQGTNSATGFGVLGQATGSAGQGVWGESFGTGFSHGVGSDGVHGVSHSTAGSGVAGVNDAKDATGVYGSDTQGYGFVTDSHVSQGRTAGGWIKAMVYIQPLGSGIVRCFNSQLNGSAASTPPCGMSFTAISTGQYLIDFGFEVDDRFATVSVEDGGTITGSFCRSTCFIGPDANQLEVVAWATDNSSTADPGAVTVVVY